jgi:hypothetical protein
MLPSGRAALFAADSQEEKAISPPQAGGRRFRIVRGDDSIAV